MRRMSWLSLGIVLMLAAAPVSWAGEFDYETDEGETVKLEKAASSKQPLAEEEAEQATKGYSLVADFTSGDKRGDLRTKVEACRRSRRESFSDYHLEMGKRGQSRVGCRFGYRPRNRDADRGIRLRLRHKATVSGRCYINITVNGKTVVYDWSPRRTSWHTTTWRLRDSLRKGGNEVVVRLGRNTRKQYWLKRIELTSGSNCLFRDAGSGPGPGPGPGPGDRWRKLYNEARRNYEDGQEAARNGNVRRARGAFRTCISKCERVRDKARRASLREKARDLRNRAQERLRNLDGAGGDDRYARMLEDAQMMFRRTEDLGVNDSIPYYKKIIGICRRIRNNAKSRDLRRKAKALEARAQDELPAWAG